MSDDLTAVDWSEAHRLAPREMAYLNARVRELEDELSRARFAPLGDNHHNAMACPYCNPERIDPAAMNARIAELERRTSGLRCRCGVMYSPEIAREPCPVAHRETWPHEWESEREAWAMDEKLRVEAENERLRRECSLRREAQLGDFPIGQGDPHCEQCFGVGLVGKDGEACVCVRYGKITDPPSPPPAAAASAAGPDAPAGYVEH